MIIEDMSFDEQHIFWIALPEQTKIHAGEARMDAAEALSEGEYVLRQGSNIETVRLLPQSKSIESLLNRQFSLGLAHYEIVSADPQNGCVEVKMVLFRKTPELLGDFSVIISEEQWKELRKAGLYAKKFLLPSAMKGEPPYFIGAYEKTKEQRNSFTLYAKGGAIEVDLDSENRNCVRLYRVRKNSRNEVPRTATLFQGDLNFLDEKESKSAESFRAMQTFKQLSEKGIIAGDYIKDWNQYGDIEGEILLDRARRIGALRFNNCEPDNDGKYMRFYLEGNIPPILRTLNDSDSFRIIAKGHLPEYLNNNALTWDDYVEKEEKLPRDDKYDFVNFDGNVITLECSKQFGEQCCIIYDISGTRISLKRQMDARQRIARGEAGIPHLNLLLEGNTDKLSRFAHRQRIAALTPFVQNKVFNITPPTDMQARAVDIALNTPDIALIQGPPGTGKTTVISAIIERINEEFNKNQDVKGQILVSAFQHDAVENLMEKLSVNALPIYKFGERRSDKKEGRENDVNRRMDDWINGLRQRIQEKYPELTELESLRHAEDCYSKYLYRPSIYQAKELITALEEVSDALPSSLYERFREMKQKYFMVQSSSEIGTERDKIGAIRALRVTEETAKDDGKNRARDFLAAFQDELEEDEKKLLLSFLTSETTQPEVYKSMGLLQKKYLRRYLPIPEYHKPKIDNALDELYMDIHEAIQETASYADKKQEILSRFLNALEYDPIGARDSILECTPVYPATVQQSEGKDIRNAKGVRRNMNLEFDTVVVDEAARCSPMDLMIPMANARRRIILVGDHKQLPHILDDEICRKMEEDQTDSGLESDIKENLSKSLFEHLFLYMQDLEKRDGIPRTVTLDKQFRMHPLIGHFVSQQFYGGEVQSPRRESEFSQELPMMDGKPIAWRDVPYQEGGERRAGTSRVREVEAQAAASLLDLWLKSPEGRGLSFGVISFYRAQSNEIYRALADYGIADGKTLKEEYKFIEVDGKRKERLRIGTVDAFQGMEFDVVLLLMVRTHKLPLSELKAEKDYNRIFGHLRSKNRLCVSMSRGKKVLVVVGDKALAQSDAGRNKDFGIPELSSFADLCETSGKII